jgi:cytochrome c biogenesis protein CcmG/thiol:disulfide interchange protein DsbE
VSEGSTTIVEGPRGSLTIWIVLPVAVVLGLLVLLLATRDVGGDHVDRSLEGRLAPTIAGVTTSGDTFDLDDERGRWLVVNFFSTNCQPCIVEHPELVAFQEAHAAAGDASVVSVAFDDSADNVREFFAENGGEWPVLVEDTGSFAISYGVTGVPESYLVAPSGIIALKIIGGVEQADLESVIGQFEEAAA